MTESSLQNIIAEIDECIAFVTENGGSPYNLFTTDAAHSLIMSNRRACHTVDVNGRQESVIFKYRYGTSGFRGAADTLNSVMVRVGFLAVLRSLACDCAGVGVMVTASHNPECDNGVKIIDPSGEMLDGTWESMVTDIANCSSGELIDFLNGLATKRLGSRLENVGRCRPVVFIGRDTRPHSAALASLVENACRAVNCDVLVRNLGEVTTPQCHYTVRRANQMNNCDTIDTQLYFTEIFDAFRLLIAEVGGKNSTLPGELVVDCANGIGAHAMTAVTRGLSDMFSDGLRLMNVPSDGRSVNDECGAEHVQKEKKFPYGFNGPSIANVRCASVDGDCDRLVYFSATQGDGDLILFDGDKIICLFYAFLKPYVQRCGVDLKVGIVQTAYANGASTQYISDELKEEVVMTKTGVKHLHHAAKQFDISIYFEANGHGTILFSEECIAKLERFAASQKDQDATQACRVLLLASQVSNQAIGDAMADLLLCEAALVGLGWSTADWAAIYSERPQKLTKLRVADRTVFETTNAEQTCVRPIGLQEAIDKCVSACGAGARSFVRPSGTEDVVRVYAEARTEADVEKLVLQVMRVVFDAAGGVGDRP